MVLRAEVIPYDMCVFSACLDDVTSDLRTLLKFTGFQRPYWTTLLLEGSGLRISSLESQCVTCSPCGYALPRVRLGEHALLHVLSCLENCSYDVLRGLCGNGGLPFGISVLRSGKT